MRIAVVGGADTSARAARLAGLGIEVSVLQIDRGSERTYLGHEEEERDGMEVRRLFVSDRLSPNPILWEYHDPVIGRYLRSALGAWSPDVIHIDDPGLATGAALAVGALYPAPVVVSVTDPWPVCPTRTLRRVAGDDCPGPEADACVQCLEEAGAASLDCGAGLRIDDAAPIRLEELAEPTPWAMRAAAVRRADHLQKLLRRIDAVLLGDGRLEGHLEAWGVRRVLTWEGWDDPDGLDMAVGCYEDLCHGGSTGHLGRPSGS